MYLRRSSRNSERSSASRGIALPCIQSRCCWRSRNRRRPVVLGRRVAFPSGIMEAIPRSASEWRLGLGHVVEADDDLVGFLFRVAKSQAADHELDAFMTLPRSHPG